LERTELQPAEKKVWPAGASVHSVSQCFAIRTDYNYLPFLKGGLAARASQVLSRAHTSVTLWQKEIENQAPSDDHSTLSGASPASWPKPDLSMTIVKIVHPPSTKSNNQNIPCFGIALCRVHIHSSSANDPRAHLSFNVNSHTLVKALFSFATSPTSPKNAVRNPSHFGAMAEVLTWKPWREVKTASGSAPDAPEHHNTAAGIESEPEDTAATQTTNRPADWFICQRAFPCR
jgi:hypothetical protein